VERLQTGWDLASFPCAQGLLALRGGASVVQYEAAVDHRFISCKLPGYEDRTAARGRLWPNVKRRVPL
jgi:hypothetical protein